MIEDTAGRTMVRAAMITNDETDIATGHRSRRAESVLGARADLTLASIFRAAWLGLVEAVLAGLSGCLSQAGMASRPVSLRWGGLS